MQKIPATREERLARKYFLRVATRCPILKHMSNTNSADQMPVLACHIRQYISGEFTVTQEEVGIGHGLLWVLRRNGLVECDSRTLGGAKRAAQSLGAAADWSLQR
jgi:hypothetical protein